MLTVKDNEGNIFANVNDRYLWAKTTRQLLAYWISELHCTVAPIILITLLEDQFRHALARGNLPFTNAPSIRKLSELTSLPRSTIQRKIQLLVSLNLVEQKKDKFFIKFDESGVCETLKQLPKAKDILDGYVIQIRQNG